MEVYWFSNRCPFFSAHDAEIYLNQNKEECVNKDGLINLGFVKAARWLEKNKSQWKFFCEELKKELELLNKNNVQIIYWNSQNYPISLKNIYYPPAVLMVRGHVGLLHQVSIAVVGAREPTDLGRQWVQQNVAELSNHFVIVSGGARGIDYEAHRACIKKKNKTIAFLPSGILKPYPKTHDFLFSEILNTSGLLVTEFISKDFVIGKNFHQRNRLIAGLAKVVIIVEAALKSGTLMTANKALSENKEVYIVPGSPLINNYAGSLEILYQGAELVRDSKDIIEKINGLS